MSKRGFFAVALALALLASPAGAQAAAGLEPGVHADPGSPAGKEYAIPLSQARSLGSSPSQPAAGEHALFGAGINPPSGGGSGGGRSGGAPPAGHRGGGRARAAKPIAPPSTAAAPALSAAALRAARSPGASDGSLLALLGGGVAILVLGAFGGIVLRRARRPSSAT